jgi:hypothetical protein
MCVVGIMPSRGAGKSSPPLKNFEIEVSQMAFPAFWEQILGKILGLQKIILNNGAFSEIRNLGIVTISCLLHRYFLFLCR